MNLARHADRARRETGVQPDGCCVFAIGAPCGCPGAGAARRQWVVYVVSVGPYMFRVSPVRSMSCSAVVLETARRLQPMKRPWPTQPASISAWPDGVACSAGGIVLLDPSARRRWPSGRSRSAMITCAPSVGGREQLQNGDVRAGGRHGHPGRSSGRRPGSRHAVARVRHRAAARPRQQTPVGRRCSRSRRRRPASRLARGSRPAAQSSSCGSVGKRASAGSVTVRSVTAGERGVLGHVDGTLFGKAGSASGT